MRADLHTHTIYSDGELIPAELVRRAMALKHDVIAITDHVDMSNVEFVVSNVVKACELSEDYIRVIPGVEITHVPPRLIADVARKARKLGAQWIVVHGEKGEELGGTPALAGFQFQLVAPGAGKEVPLLGQKIRSGGLGPQMIADGQAAVAEKAGLLQFLFAENDPVFGLEVQYGDV